MKLNGLLPDKMYKNVENEKVYSGDYLMNVGLYFDDIKDFESQLIRIELMHM